MNSKGIIRSSIASSLAVAALATAGCGGGSSQISSGFPSAPATTTSSTFLPQGPGVAGGTALRDFTPGDVLTYDVQGTITTDIVSATDSITTVTSNIIGTDTLTVTADNFPTPGTLKVTDTLTYNATAISNQPFVEITEIYLQKGNDLNGVATYAEVARRDLDMTMVSTTPVGDLPLLWGSNVNLAEDGTFYPVAGITPGIPPGSGATGDSISISSSLAMLALQNVPSTTTAYSAWQTARTEHNILNLDVVSRLKQGQNIWDGWVMRRERKQASTEWWVPVLSGYVERNEVINDTYTVLQSWTFNPQTSVYTIVPRTQHTNMSLQMVLHSRNTG